MPAAHQAPESVRTDQATTPAPTDVRDHHSLRCINDFRCLQSGARQATQPTASRTIPMLSTRVT